jgi:hypothetical protein
VLGSRQIERRVGAKEIGAPGASHEQASTGEHGCGLIGVPLVHQEGQVLRRVTGRLGGDDPKRPQGELVRLTERFEGEGIPGPSRAGDRCPGRRAKLQRPRDIVVVDVGLHDVGDVRASGSDRSEDRPDVSLWIDDHRLVARYEQIARVSQSPGEKRLDVHAAPSGLAPS